MNLNHIFNSLFYQTFHEIGLKKFVFVDEFHVRYIFRYWSYFHTPLVKPRVVDTSSLICAGFEWTSAPLLTLLRLDIRTCCGEQVTINSAALHEITSGQDVHVANRSTDLPPSVAGDREILPQAGSPGATGATGAAAGLAGVAWPGNQPDSIAYLPTSSVFRYWPANGIKHRRQKLAKGS